MSLLKKIKNTKTAKPEVKKTVAATPAPAAPKPAVATASAAPKAPVASPAPVAAKTPAITTETIAARAYTLWEKSGRPQGRDTDFWFQAEQQLKQDSQSFAA